MADDYVITPGKPTNGKSFLIDTTKCFACRSCQVACKQWNGLDAEAEVRRQTDLIAEAEGVRAEQVPSFLDVTDFFEGDTPAISGLRPAQRRSYLVRRLDGDRSFIGRVRSYPLNVNVRHTLNVFASDRCLGVVLLLDRLDAHAPAKCTPRPGEFWI